MHPALILERKHSKQASHMQVNQSYTEDMLCPVCANLANLWSCPLQHGQMCPASAEILERTGLIKCASDFGTGGKQTKTLHVHSHLISVQHIFSYTFGYRHNKYNIHYLHKWW
jgi:hypothetical protein